MSVITEVTKATFAGSGTVGPFAYTWQIWADADLAVIQKDANNVETLLTLNTDYTVTGATVSTGGTVTLTVALPVGETLTIMRAMDYLQSTAYVNLQQITATSLNNAFDKLEHQIQQVKEEADRALQIPRTDTNTVPMYLKPSAGKLIGWDAAGTGLYNYPTTALSVPVIDHIGNHSDNLGTAITDIGATQQYLMVQKAITLTGNATVPATLSLDIPQGGSITLGAYNLVINGPFTGSPGCFIENGAGKVTFGMTTGQRVIHSSWWGDIGDDSTDNYAALNSAFTCLNAMGTAGGIAGNGKLVIGPGLHRYSQELNWKGNDTQLEMQGTLSFTGTGAGPAFTIGDAVTVANSTYRLYGNIRIVDANGTVWTTAKIGVKLINVVESQLWLDKIGGNGLSGDGGFATGVYLYGDTHGCSYNQFHINRITECKIGITTGRGTWQSSVNANTFYGGRFAHFQTHSGEWADSYHIKLNYSNSGNTFVNPSFENDNIYCAYFDNGFNNSLITDRIETDADYRIIIGPLASNAIVNASYSSRFDPYVSSTGHYAVLCETATITDYSGARLGKKWIRWAGATSIADYTHDKGEITYNTGVTDAAILGWICTQAGTFSTATANTGDTVAPITGDTTAYSKTISGIASTTGYAVGDWVTVSAGFPSTTLPYQIEAVTANTITLELFATSTQAGVTVSSCTIAGITDTSDFYLGQYITASAGFASTSVPYQIIGHTSSKIAINTPATSAQTNITIATPAPIIRVMGYAGDKSRGTLTLSNAGGTTTTVNNTAVQTTSRITLTATSANAAKAVGHADGVYVSTKNADTSFVVTHPASPGAGATMDYIIEN